MHAQVLHTAEKATSEHSEIMGTFPIAMILDVVDAVPIDYTYSCLYIHTHVYVLTYTYSRTHILS